MSEDIAQNDLMFKLIKIYIVEYLTTVHGFKNFQHEAINMLALHIIRTINEMAVSIKRLAAFQGILIPNCLHIVDFVHQRKYVDFFRLIQFITKQSNQGNKNTQAFYAGLENLGRSLLQDQAEQINQHKPQSLYPNIQYIPHIYYYKPEQNPLPIKAPVDEGLKKPAEYTYRNVYEKVEKVDNNVERLANYANREMRRSLGIFTGNEKEEMGTGGRPRKITPAQQKELDRRMMKNTFSMINYI